MSKEASINNIADFPSEHRDNLRILEALLFAANEPLDAESLKARLPKGANLNKLLNLLKAQYENRGVNLIKTGKRWSLKTAQDLAPMMKKEKIVQRKLSKAATETLHFYLLKIQVVKNFLTLSIQKLFPPFFAV